MKTPDQQPKNSPNKKEILQKYLDQGFIDGSTVYGKPLEDQMWNKKVMAIFIGEDVPIIYSNLELQEFLDQTGYGFKLPNGDILLISRYQRNLSEPLKNWLFKIK